MICQYSTLFDFIGRIMSNYWFCFILRFKSPRFESFWFVLVYRLYRLDLAMERITKSTIRPSLTNWLEKWAKGKFKLYAWRQDISTRMYFYSCPLILSMSSHHSSPGGPYCVTQFHICLSWLCCSQRPVLHYRLSCRAGTASKLKCSRIA